MPTNPTISLTDNLNHEGTYRMLSPGTKNQYASVPYSKVRLAQTRGYNFGDGDEFQRYQNDFEAAQNSPPVQTAAQLAKDFAIGVGKGVLSDLGSIARWGQGQLPASFTNTDLNSKLSAGLDKLQEATKPNHIAQKAGRGWEQANSNFALGLGKGALTTVSAADRWERKHLPAPLTSAWYGLGDPVDLDKQDERKTAHNRAQSLGKGVEQGAEFMIPGDAEEAAAAKLLQYYPELKSLAPIATSALSSGLVNKSQGNGFWEGAALGGTARGAANALRSFAPVIAQQAMGIGSKNAATGETILNETTGIHPAAIGAQAQQRISQYLDDLLGRARNSHVMIDLAPARSEAESLLNRAGQGNNKATIEDIKELQKQLSEWHISGDAIPQHITPEEALHLRDGLEDLFRRWQGGNPEAVKGALSTELSTAIPGYEAAENQINDLRKIAKSQEGKETQLFRRRLVNNIPGLPDASPMTLEGAKKTASKLLASPEAQLAMARTLNSGVIPAAAKALVAGYEASRGPQRWMEQGSRKLAVSGIDDATIARLRNTRDGQQLLMDAGDAAVGSRRLAAIVNDLRGQR